MYEDEQAEGKMETLRKKLADAENQIEELQRNNKQLEHHISTLEGRHPILSCDFQTLTFKASYLSILHPPFLVPLGSHGIRRETSLVVV